MTSPIAAVAGLRATGQASFTAARSRRHAVVTR